MNFFDVPQYATFSACMAYSLNSLLNLHPNFVWESPLTKLISNMHNYLSGRNLRTLKEQLSNEDDRTMSSKFSEQSSLLSASETVVPSYASTVSTGLNAPDLSLKNRRNHGSMPDEGGYATFLRIEGDSDEGELVPMHVVSHWDLHFKKPFFHSMLCHIGACDGRDYGANERNYLAWVRLAAGLVSTATTFILSYYLPAGTSIFGPENMVAEPTLQNRGALAYGLVFLLFALGCFGYAYYIYVEQMAIIGRRYLILEFSWHCLTFMVVMSVAVIAACGYMMAGGVISP